MKANFLFDNINRLMNKKGWIDIPSSGVSMYPLIKEGDVCRFRPIKHDDYFKKGEIILYMTDEGQLVGHRFIHSFNQDGEQFYILKGDTNVFWDYPINISQMIGKLDYIKKSSFLIRAEGHISRFWGTIAIALPVLPRLCKRFFFIQQKLKLNMKNV